MKESERKELTLSVNTGTREPEGSQHRQMSPVLRKQGSDYMTAVRKLSQTIHNSQVMETAKMPQH
jgi:hypothetical protein